MQRKNVIRRASMPLLLLDGLRRHVAALVADARHSAASTGGASAGDALYLLADVLSRADAKAGDLAKIADDRGIAGQQCERSYEALTREMHVDLPR